MGTITLIRKIPLNILKKISQKNQFTGKNRHWLVLQLSQDL